MAEFKTNPQTGATEEQNIDGQSALMGDHPTCRGCAGSGLRHEFPARMRQVAEQPVKVPAWTDPVTGRHRGRTIPGPGQLAPFNPGTGSARVTDTRWSLNDCLYTARTLESLGAAVPTLVYEDADRCDWCHGTGKPSLSTRTLEIGVQAANG